ncbi:MAG: hypothetical protein GXP05_14365 [Alphaproteobacteria bacterium]|nr:hypothetical protein [Alphaproteobacteria bacterium]
MQRGEQQALISPELKSEVRNVVTGRLEDSREVLAEPAAKEFLEAQWVFSEQYASTHLEEVRGLAKGYGLSPRDLFAYMHLGTLDAVSRENDGCSVIVLSHTPSGPLLAKNRDLGDQNQPLQRVVLHKDPSRRQNWCMYVTSLGSPGAYSSGINSHGLAVGDTHVGYSKPGVGWLRYFLMTEILWKASTVEEALDLISSVPHVGGGALVLADQAGNIASVELGHGELRIEKADSGYLIHTNHYLGEKLIPFQSAESEQGYFGSSEGRLAKMDGFLAGNASPITADTVAGLLASHGSRWQSMCCHGDIGDGYTISSAIYFCTYAGLRFCGEKPCSGNWNMFLA